jgi:hypothetical protein
MACFSCWYALYWLARRHDELSSGSLTQIPPQKTMSCVALICARPILLFREAEAVSIRTSLVESRYENWQRTVEPPAVQPISRERIGRMALSRPGMIRPTEDFKAPDIIPRSWSEVHFEWPGSPHTYWFFMKSKIIATRFSITSTLIEPANKSPWLGPES